MNEIVHAAMTSRSAPSRSLIELLVSSAACTFIWGWPEIVFPAQAVGGITFALAMGVPTGVCLWAGYLVADAALERAMGGRRRKF
jgi:hypothetical protein